jgi:hypothetical protein
MTATLRARTRYTTAALHPGVVVLTRRYTVGSDFGLPLVAPTHGRARAVPRTVRNRVHCRGGHVVWFTDGTKTAPTHGSTVWDAAEGME